MIVKTEALSPAELDLLYPSSDAPMVESSDQYDWLTLIKAALEALFAERQDVVVAGDMMWYPVQGEKHLCVAPDVFVAFGPEKKSRKSYKQFVEGVPPQVVFEMLSESNTLSAMTDKLDFYDRYGVQEYYTYDPTDHLLRIWTREPAGLREQFPRGVWRSPLLGVRLESTPGEPMRLFLPNGEEIVNYTNMKRQRDDARAEKEAERLAKEEERRGREVERLAKEAERKAKEEERRAKEEERKGREAERMAKEEEQRAKEAERQARLQAEAELARLQAEIEALKKSRPE